MDQRINLFYLWGNLLEDPIYGNLESVNEINKKLIKGYMIPRSYNLNKVPFNKTSIGRSDLSVWNFILYLIGRARINTYFKYEKYPTGWFGYELLRKFSTNLEIDWDEFRDKLQKEDLLLPTFWFPKESNNTIGYKETISIDELEKYICKLRISYDSDESLKIQEPGKKERIFDIRNVDGFKSGNKAWKELQNIMDNGNRFNVSSSLDRKEYDRKSKVLKRIDKALKNLIQKEYGIQFPKNFHLYKKCEGEQGTYQFKFKVAEKNKISTKYDKYTKEQAVQKIKELNQQKAIEHNEKKSKIIQEDIQSLGILLFKKYSLNKQELEDLIIEKSNQDFIKEEFSDIRYENEI